MASLIGQTVSHYRILEQLGGGGMGVVYRAEDTRLKRTVALKFLPPELTRDGEAKERFVHEAQAASNLQHTNICVVHDIDETSDGRMFIVMECLEGETLKRKIERGPLKTEEAVDIAIQISHGLQQAHEKGIAHRDIKPANIMLTTQGVAKVVDFGLAKLAGRTMLTHAGSTLGTAAYMSPEQVRGEPADHRSDLWGLGVVLYEMLSGEQPFKGEFAEALCYGILNTEPVPLERLRSGLPEGLALAVRRAMEKDPDRRFQSMEEFCKALTPYLPSAPEGRQILTLRNLLHRPSLTIPAAVILVAIVAGTIWTLHRSAKERWAREEAIPSIEKLLADQQVAEAFPLALQAEDYVPGDPKLKELLRSLERRFTVKTDPPGAEVFVRDYLDTSSAWVSLGRTPLEDIRISQVFKRWRIVKAGFEPLEATEDKVNNSWDTLTNQYKLDSLGSIPEGMVRIPGNAVSPDFNGDIFLDRYEVTNKQYKAFIDAGGYRMKALWKYPVICEGRTLAWDEAMKKFSDKTGQPAPSTWELGDYPEGTGDYPVGGVSWYEAMAYAEFAQKMLPPSKIWVAAEGVWNGEFMIPLANFSGPGPRAVTASQSVSLCGAHNMAGNVKEWLSNPMGSSRTLGGGSWKDESYMAYVTESRPPSTRESDLGFRCMKVRGEKPLPSALLEPVSETSITISNREPCSEEVFQIYRNFFRYSKKPLQPAIERRDESNDAWILEKVTINAAYGGERLPVYLYLPRRITPPFQTVVWFPGSSAFMTHSYKESPSRVVQVFLKSGRAVVYPIYKGAFERYYPQKIEWTTDLEREWQIQCGKDLGRTLDYLESRPEFDMQRVAYAGLSLGGGLGVIFTAVEPRIRACILISGGLEEERAELADLGGVHYAPRIKVPVLMVNGKYDHCFPVEGNQKVLFDLLGTPRNQKHHVVLETGHDLWINTKAHQAYLDFLDRTFGPVR